MAEGCDDCLRTQLGLLSEADYPLDPLLEAPEPIYCVDGNPVTTPHKAFAGPLIATLTVTPPTLAASGTLEGDMVTIDWVNETARTVNLAIIVSGSVFLDSHSATYVFTFTYGFNLAVSSPFVAGVAETASTTNSDDLQVVNLGFIASTSVAAGGTLNLSPYIKYAVTGSGSPGQSVLHGANLSVMAFGGPA